MGHGPVQRPRLPPESRQAQQLLAGRAGHRANQAQLPIGRSARPQPTSCREHFCHRQRSAALLALFSAPNWPLERPSAGCGNQRIVALRLRWADSPVSATDRKVNKGQHHCRRRLRCRRSLCSRGRMGSRKGSLAGEITWAQVSSQHGMECATCRPLVGRCPCSCRQEEAGRLSLCFLPVTEAARTCLTRSSTCPIPEIDRPSWRWLHCLRRRARTSCTCCPRCSQPL